MNRALKQLIIMTLAACLSIPAGAAVIHKWVDTDGVTHYSDEAPASGEIPVTVIDVPTAHSEPGSPAENYYSITNQWERMRRERIERDKLALEKAGFEADRRASSPAVVYVNQPATSRTVSALPAYLYQGPRHHRMHRKFGHRYRRGHVGYSHPRPRQQADLGYFPHVD
ncbi:MAG: DUF4124 domain-containing protein [Gammaproteobacteria bacterium]|nr:DUF4124 domain-containing protein [Gammaproteobacteria bacterium]MDH3534864.1 DUF4124 domain-containing protein [Gammaproteobacteria bacterium]